MSEPQPVKVKVQIGDWYADQEWTVPPMGLWDNSIETWAKEQAAFLIGVMVKQARELHNISRPIAPNLRPLDSPPDLR